MRKLINGDIFKFKIELGGKTTVKDLIKYKEDVRLRLGLKKLEVIKKKTSIWFVASKSNRQPYAELLSFLESNEYDEAIKQMILAHPIGIDEMGHAIISDLTLYPHALIGGTSGSGKSMAVKALLFNFIYFNPERLNLVICDQVGDLTVFNGFPHLACPVITDFDQFYQALQALQYEMERRIKLKGFEEYSYLPYIVFVVDEFITFITGNEQEKKDARKILTDILRRGRHARIHAILVAFDPTKENLKLNIADLPTKFLFRVSRTYNSLAVIGKGGAEKLSGNGELLFQSSQSGELKKIQGFYISEVELAENLNYQKVLWESKPYHSDYFFRIDLETSTTPQKMQKASTAYIYKQNRQLMEIVIWSLQQSEISGNQLTQNFQIGWNTAKNFMIKLEDLGIIGELEAKLPRKVCIEIPEKTLDFLKSNGYSDEQIDGLLQKRSIESTE